MNLVVAHNQINAAEYEQMQGRTRLAKQCPCCDAVGMQHSGGFGFDSLITCGVCGTVYDAQNLKEDATIYSETYFLASDAPQSGYFNYEQDRAGNMVNFRARFKSVEKLVPSKGAFLDVGCALGHALDVAFERGWNLIFGIDSSEFCVRKVLENGYLASQNSMVEMAKNKNASFDFIMMSDVLEHFSEPQKQIEAAFKLLRPGGVLFVHTPNSSSFAAWLLKSRWFHIKPGEHLVYFSKTGLHESLCRAGFSQVDVRADFSWLSPPCALGRLKRWGWSWVGVFDWFFKIPFIERVFVPMPSGNMRAIARKPLS